MRLFFGFCLFITLAACAGEDRASMLGIARNTPDEFAILKREPLAVPIDIRDPAALPAPGSLAGATPSSQSRGASVVTGQPLTPEMPSVGFTAASEQPFLNQAIGTTPVDPMIRQRLKTDAEDSQDTLTNPLNLVKSDKILVPQEEYARLKALKEAGKPLSEGQPVARQEQNPLIQGILP
ncbi:MAG: DUF3035 domain-containing protein [Alphaproteobacteria bacterium]